MGNTLSALLLSHHITLDTHDPSALLYKLESSNSNLHRSSALRIPQPPSTCIAPILWDNHGLLLPRNSRTLPHHPPVQRQADSSERGNRPCSPPPNRRPIRSRSRKEALPA